MHNDREESYKNERRRRDANDRKTVEGVLDRHTFSILTKLLKQRMLTDLFGVVSVGKEANIYLGIATREITSKMCKDPEDLPEIFPVAVKVYKTSTMVFKDRERYIIGERRFKRYSKGNSRKLVKIWAEKEVRNLNRLQKAKIPSPTPLFIRRNILVMRMIGDQNAILQKNTTDPLLPIVTAQETTTIEDDSNGIEDDSNSIEDDSNSIEDDSNSNSNDVNDDSNSNDTNNDSDDTEEEDSNDSDTYLSDQLDNTVINDSNDSYLNSESENDLESVLSTLSSNSKLDNREDNEIDSISGMGGIAPNLKNAHLKDDQVQDAYFQVVSIIKRMYSECSLVHADLSEYNLLYWENTVYVIDVSQSVERDHPNANSFLRMDINNITRYFSKLGANTIPPDDLYNTVIDMPRTQPTPMNNDRKGNSTPKHYTSNKLSKEESKERRKETKEKRREQRKTKISKKQKKALSRKVQIKRK
ncbi:RIO kinase 1 [Nematocida sp. AWRm80]|nr:RIO kinase 1 [Nematocida sp. AWRm80]